MYKIVEEALLASNLAQSDLFYSRYSVSMIYLLDVSHLNIHTFVEEKTKKRLLFY